MKIRRVTIKQFAMICEAVNGGTTHETIADMLYMDIQEFIDSVWIPGLCMGFEVFECQ